MISCTITIKEKDNGEFVHEEILDALPTQTSNNPQTFVVRSAEDFVSDSDPNYLELRYPDLLPFGRGGFGETRKIPISKKRLVAYYANLSTRQFQKIDFVLPLYDYIVRTLSYNKAMVRAKLPSRMVDKDGSVMPQAVAYSKISKEDMRKSVEYQIECIKRKKLGQRAPRPPKSVSGLASSFFTDQKIANQTIQHSQAAANRNRQEVYAAHANNGKAHIWLTISPDDAKAYKVMWFALGPEEAIPHANAIPLGTKRFKILSEHPVAAALHFQRVLDIIIEDIIGWCSKKGKPYKRGGLFGVPKAWLRIVEEQSRLTLHTHILIWLYGHSKIEYQMNNALLCDNQQHLPEDDVNPTITETDPVSLKKKRLKNTLIN